VGDNLEKTKGENQEEIDVVALNEKTKDILFAECTWSNEKVDTDLYNDLKRKAKLVQLHNDNRVEHYALFSKSGFTNEIKAIAKKEHLLLFDLEVIEKTLKE
jgi:AAA+ ATPase superfamily predicted ATPase